MRALLQRVKFARVEIDGQLHSQIDSGLLIFLGVGENDSTKEADLLAKKAAHLRIFEDENEIMNLSCIDVGGSALVVSQFTLYANCIKGRRPDFLSAAKPEKADPLYEYFSERIKEEGINDVKTGVFGADMKISLLNDGPVTILLDTKELMKC